MALYFTIFISLIVATLKAQTTPAYQVERIQDQLVINGKGDSPLWKKANELTDFTFPWEDATPPLTSFRAIHNDDWIYFLFTVQDNDVKIYVHTNEKTGAVRSDRTEIFLRKDSSMSPYYCLEIDAIARIFDCRAEFYRKLDTSWSWPKGQLLAQSTRTDNGYITEIAISKRSLNDLGLINDNKIEAGIFRAECVQLNEGNAVFRWISWVKPDSPTPDFHTPSAFGILQLK
jgi:hypothetical protein